jgi:aminoglycoside 6-adenylyltransferase
MVTNPIIEQYEKRIAAWANTQDNIRSIVVVGSQARNDHPADEWSDLDLQVFCNDFQCYLTDTNWLKTFCKVWICLPIQKENQEPELLVVFKGGQKVDFHFCEVAELQRMIKSQTLGVAYQRGYKFLVDKDDSARKLPPLSKTYLQKIPPSETEFLRVIELFWYEALFNAKMIRRRELWSIKVIDIMGLKQRMFQMFEWQAQAKHGWVYDTWYGGKNLKEWVESKVWEKLNLVFSHFDASDSWRGLIETMKLFEEVAIETTRYLGYEYPEEMSKNIKELIERLCAEDEKLV